MDRTFKSRDPGSGGDGGGGGGGGGPDEPPEPPSTVSEVRKEAEALDDAAKRLQARCETLNILLVELVAKTSDFSGLDNFGKASLAEFGKALIEPYVAVLTDKLMHSAEAQYLEGVGGLPDVSDAIQPSLGKALIVVPQLPQAAIAVAKSEMDEKRAAEAALINSLDNGALSPPIFPGSPGSESPTTARPIPSPVVVPRLPIIIP